MKKMTTDKFMWNSNHPSLRKWRLNNFKSVAQPVEIDLAPLTVVVGANSSGKSTLIQSILMLAQNALHSNEKSPAKGRGVFELNGPLTQLGSFRETYCDLTASKKPTMEFGGVWFAKGMSSSPSDSDGKESGELRNGERFIDWQMSLIPFAKSLDSGLAVVNNANAIFFKDGFRSEEVLSKSIPDKVSKILKSKYEELSFNHTAEFRQFFYKHNIESKTVSDIFDDSGSNLSPVYFQVGLPVSGLWKKNIVSYLFESQEHVISTGLLMGPNIDPDLSESEISLHKYLSYESFIDDYAAQLGEWGKKIVQQDRTAEDKDIDMTKLVETSPIIQYEWFPAEVLEYFLSEENSLTSKSKDDFYIKFFQDVTNKFNEYFGDAEWTQETTLCFPNGTRGINPKNGRDSMLTSITAEWNRYLGERVLYLGPLRVAPRSSYGIGSSVENNNLPLGESGEFLAKRLFTDRTPKAYPIVEKGLLRDGRMTLEEAVTFWYEELVSGNETNKINVDAPDRQGYPLKIGKRTLANVGFGASQILPVLGLCLSAAPGDLILLEQPELHLNPGMQQRLADFLLLMTKTGRQIIVETHSEYLITRLRRNAASTPDDHKYFTVIYVERDPETGTSYRTVSVDDQGDLSEWPKGFFDHVAEDLRVLMRRAAERQSGKTQN